MTAPSGQQPVLLEFTARPRRPHLVIYRTSQPAAVRLLWNRVLGVVIGAAVQVGSHMICLRWARPVATVPPRLSQRLPT